MTLLPLMMPWCGSLLIVQKFWFVGYKQSRTAYTRDQLSSWPPEQQLCLKVYMKPSHIGVGYSIRDTMNACMRQLALLMVLPINSQTSSGNSMETQPVQPMKVSSQKPFTLHNLVFTHCRCRRRPRHTGIERVQPHPAQSASIAFANLVYRAH